MIPRASSRSAACSPTTYFPSKTSCRIVSNSCPISEDLLGRHTGREILQNVLHRHPQPPDAWLPAAFVRLNRNQVSVIHDLHRTPPWPASQCAPPLPAT